MNGRYPKTANRRKMSVIYAIILAAFTIYAALDTFVIARVYTVEQDAPSSLNTGTAYTQQGTGGEQQSGGGIIDEGADTQQDAAPQSESAVEPAVTGSSYSDGNISITLSEYEYLNTALHIADIQLSSAQYLKTALAHNSYGRNIKAATSQIAAENNAILAINGDYYGSQQSGYVIRNGVLYRDTAKNRQEDLVIYADGSFGIINESEVSAQELINMGAVNVLCFGPALVENGGISVTASDEVGKAMRSNPRTAIGVIDDLHYVFVVADGRSDESEGLSLYELAQVMQSLGVETAYNLDGGGSSTMVFNGELVNNPTTNGGKISERSVSDIVYIGY